MREGIVDLYNHKKMQVESVIDNRIGELSDAMFLIFAGKQSHLSFVALHDTCYYLSLFGDGSQIIKNVRIALSTAIDRMCTKLKNNTYHQDIANMFGQAPKSHPTALHEWPNFHHSLAVIHQTIINLNRIEGAAHILYYEGIAQYLDKLVLDKKNRHIYPIWVGAHSTNDLKIFLKTADHCKNHTEMIHLIGLIQQQLDDSNNTKDVN